MDGQTDRNEYDWCKGESGRQTDRQNISTHLFNLSEQLLRQTEGKR